MIAGQSYRRVDPNALQILKTALRDLNIDLFAPRLRLGGKGCVVKSFRGMLDTGHAIAPQFLINVVVHNYPFG